MLGHERNLGLLWRVRTRGFRARFGRQAQAGGQNDIYEKDCKKRRKGRGIPLPPLLRRSRKVIDTNSGEALVVALELALIK